MIWWGPIWSIMLQLHRYVLLTTVQSHSTRNKGRCRPISELSEQSPLVSTIRVCQTPKHSSEKLQTQYFPLLETFYFLCLWVLRGRGLLSWVSSMLCAWPTQGESSHPRESVLKVKAGPLFNDYSGANLTGPGKWKRHLREQSQRKRSRVLQSHTWDSEQGHILQR